MKVKEKDKKDIVDLSTLNSDQLKAFESLRDYLSDKEDQSVYVLKGWAGTGKTYCISVLVRYVLEVMHSSHAWYKVAVTGPTNKSVRVIKKTAGIKNNRVSFQTIHKLLGLKEKITQDGQQIFENDGFLKPGINTIKLLIIDEVSMLNDDLFQEIIKYRGKLKIICMGDPAQIPPVGRPDCIPFREELADFYKINTIQLKKVMRQKDGNSIIDVSVKIRSDLGSTNQVAPENLINSKGEGVEFLNLNDDDIRKGFSKILEGYFKTKEFEKDSEYAKIIAWRNKTVASMNSLIRKVLYGDESLSSKILLGEKLIANTPIIDGEMIIFNTNDEFTVERFEVKSKDHRFKISDDPDDELFGISLKYYSTTVSYLDEDDDLQRKTISILHEDSENDFNKLANILKLRAIRKAGKDKTWIQYYNFLRRFADVSYAYAITCHKSQGSTYNTAFVLEDDINMNFDIVERNRIKYTAYTRASKKVYILKRF
jgi:exodeoxyribonuclease-5